MRDAPGVVGTTLARIEPATAIVALLMLGALVLRLTQMHQSLYGDEVWTYQDVVGRSLGSTIHAVHAGAENSPPLFFILAWAAAKLGDPTVSIRIPSLILGIATLPLILALGRETVGRAPGVIGAAIVAASPFSIYYGIEARPYATMAFFVTLSTLALVRAVRTSERRWWVLYALAAAAAAYSHYTAVFVLAVQAAWSVWARRDRLREPLLANLLIVVLYIPWLPYVRGKQLGVIGLLEPLKLHNVVTDALRLIPGYPYASLKAIPTYAGLAVLGALALLGAVAVARRARDLLREHPRQGAGAGPLIVALALGTPVGVLLYSVLGTDIWDARSLYASVPAAALVLAALLWAIPRAARALAVAAVLITLLAGTIRAISPSYARPPFRAVAAYLDRVASPKDAIILYPSFVDQAVPAQLKKPHHVLSASPGAWRVAEGGTRAYAVIDDAAAAWYGMPRTPGFQLVAGKHYTGLWSFRLLTYRALRPAVSRTR